MPRQGSGRLAALRPFACIVVLGLAVHGQTLFFDFSYFDDNHLVLDYQPHLRTLSAIPHAFTDDVFHTREGVSYYRPLLTVSFAVDAMWGGPDPFAYHLTNVALHLIACCLLYLFLCDLQPHRGRALLVTLLFTVHPVLTQAVAWINGRNDPLVAVYLLAAFLAFRRATAGGGRWAPFVAHGVLWAAAIFTKETAIVLPALCLASLALDGRERHSAGITRVVPLWVLIAATWFFARRAAMAEHSAYSAADMFRSAVEHAPALFSYLGKIAVPWPLSVFPVLADMLLWPGVVATAGFLLLAWAGIAREERRVAGFGAAWFALFLLPAIAAPSISATPEFLEHRVYVPLIGLALVCARLFPNGWPGGTRTATAMGIGLLAAFSTLTVAHGRHFRNRQTFWSQAVATSPHSALAHTSLGFAYYTNEQPELAEREWRTAIALDPRERLAHGNLGVLLMNRGDYDAAEREYRAEMEVNPQYGRVYFHMGQLSLRRGEPATTTLAWWEQAVEKDPLFPDAYKNLIGLSYNIGDRARAAEYLRRAQAHGVELPAEMVERVR